MMMLNQHGGSNPPLAGGNGSPVCADLPIRLQKAAADVARQAAENERLAVDNEHLRQQLHNARLENERLARDVDTLASTLAVLTRRYREEFVSRKAAEAAIDDARAYRAARPDA
jgi:hypothetical protein